MAIDARRREMAQTMAGRMKRNSYTQGSKRKHFFGYPQEGDNGFSDCSSAVREAIRRVLGIDVGSNTVAQVNNDESLEWVEFANGNRCPTIKLMPGDLLYFKGTDKSRPYRVGHVEMVDEDTDYLLGHGSGTGPRRIGLKSYCDSRYRSGKGLIGVKRVVLAGEERSETVSSLGKRLLKIRSPLMRGEDVRELQGHLLNLGYDCDGIDGIYGPNTAAAVKAFQHSALLETDGEYGPLTHAELLAAVEGGDANDEPDGAQTAEPRKLIATGDCWIRALPSACGAKCAVLCKGREIERCGEDTENWLGVRWNGKQRYVSRKYVEVAKNERNLG